MEVQVAAVTAAITTIKEEIDFALAGQVNSAERQSGQVAAVKCPSKVTGHSFVKELAMSQAT